MFRSQHVERLLTLKEEKKSQSLTSIADFYDVYNFLITVIQTAYKSFNITFTMKEAHETLRIVWGRSKQLQNDQEKKKN